MKFRNLEEAIKELQPLLDPTAQIRILYEVSASYDLGDREFILEEEALEYRREIEEEVKWFGLITPESEQKKNQVKEKFYRGDLDPDKFWEPDWLMLQIRWEGPSLSPIIGYPEFWKILQETASSLNATPWYPEVRLRENRLRQFPYFLEIIFKIGYSG